MRSGLTQETKRAVLAPRWLQRTDRLPSGLGFSLESECATGRMTDGLGPFWVDERTRKRKMGAGGTTRKTKEGMRGC